MIKDISITKRFTASVELDVNDTPATQADYVQYQIKPHRMSVVWTQANDDPTWKLLGITITGPRILKGDALSESVSGRREWTGRRTGNHRLDPPSWVLSIVNEVKPKGWELS